MKYLNLFLLLLLFTSCAKVSENEKSTKPRTIVTTDGELDDVDSFIRMLLYANEFKIEGLVISSSQWHYKGDGNGTKFISEMERTKALYGERTELRWPGEQWIYDLVDAYGEVHSNLIKHDPDFPSAAYLKDLIRIGNIDFEGEMAKDTPGSDFIKDKLLDDDQSPLYLQVWGGTNTIARALKSIEDEFKDTPEWEEVYDKVCQKAIIYAILDQDATYRKYIEPHWPDVTVYYNAGQFGSLAYFWKRALPQELHHYMEGGFMGEHIINNHGPLLKMYYSYGDGNPPLGELEDIYSSMEQAKNNMWGSFGQYDFISEGDSPAFLHLVDVGLQNLENPYYGGWGGRLKQSEKTPSRWEDGLDVAEHNPFTDTLDYAYAQIRWIPAIQNDFAARADWCIADYENANHAPVVSSVSPAVQVVEKGEKINLEVAVEDPDGDDLEIKFWYYQEVSTSPVAPTISSTGTTAEVSVPNDATGEIHIIAEVTDSGVHPMTQYQRFVLRVN